MVEQADLQIYWRFVARNDELEAAAEDLQRGSGPIAVDAERASGYRYGSEAYLVQMHRTGSGTFLFDPTELGTFEPLAEAIDGEEWVLHAASQDLACLAELGLIPSRIFDTELAGRLLGYERVGLGSLVERVLSISLRKAHSAADWSTRPLPEAWLEYAALDVALLPALRAHIDEELRASGKHTAAEQEFAAILERPPKPPNPEPWRKLAGGHRTSRPRDLAVARELWNARDQLARERDVAPGRLVPDASLTAAVRANPRTRGQLAGLSDFTGRASRTELDRWWSALLRGRETDDLPESAPRDRTSPPHHRSWGQRYPEAAARLDAARAAVTEEAERQGMPAENLITPDFVRRLAWEPPEGGSVDALARRLAEFGARPWQIECIAPILASVFGDKR